MSHNKFVTLEKQLADAKKTIEKLQASQTEFLTRLSHELNSPLHIILGFTALLENDEAHLTDEQLENLHEISSSAKFLHSQSKHLFKLAQFRSSLPAIEQIHICDELDQVIDRVMGEARKKSVHINLCYPDSSLVIDSYKICFDTVLGNLVINAIHYSPVNSTVTIKCSNSASGLTVSIHDNGRGIPVKMHTQVFNLFHDRSITHVQGIDMGLYLAKEYVGLMRGEIGFDSDSDKGNGTTFWVTFPN